jgi:hypothetical protein
VWNVETNIAHKSYQECGKLQGPHPSLWKAFKRPRPSERKVYS